MISDIHGCHETFKALLSTIQLTNADQLFLLGDYINKGPSSLKVLLEILELEGNVYPLIGNHDKFFLDYYWSSEPEKKEYLDLLSARDLLEAEVDTQKRIVNFLSELPYYYISEDSILVHAGFDFSLENVFADRQAMITIKNFNYDPGKVSGRSIIHGHDPTDLDLIINAATERQPVVPVDNGCVYNKERKGRVGNLVALELNERLLVVQENMDQT